jgi:hypothetical protein
MARIHPGVRRKKSDMARVLAVLVVVSKVFSTKADARLPPARMPKASRLSSGGGVLVVRQL